MNSLVHQYRQKNERDEQQAPEHGAGDDQTQLPG